MKKRVLIVDNDPDFLQARVEWLRTKGFTVFGAESRDAARECLERFSVHVAVIDIRLRNDRDEKDTTGLLLAKEEAYRVVPKIIMTNWPTYEAVREVLGPALDGLPTAVDFIAKKEGPEAMLGALNKAFEQYVHINNRLTIETSSRGPVTFTHLASLVEQNLENELLMTRADELEDLFRMLFYQHESIRIERVLWQQRGRAAVTVFAFEPSKAPESFIVAFGKNWPVTREARYYNNLAPKALGQLTTVLSENRGTVHYAANSYALVGANLETAFTLVELYRTGSDRSFNTALSALLEVTLAEWHHGNRTIEETRTLDGSYSQRLGLMEEGPGASTIAERARKIRRQIHTLGERMDLSSGRLTIRFGSQEFSYPDPSIALDVRWDTSEPVLLMSTPGTLTGDNILADSSGRTWLTDFAEAGLAPELWNFVAIEALIRFDWIDASKLQWLHEFERCLIQKEFTRIDPTEVEPSLRKPMRAIQTIRRLASRYVRKNESEYHLGILFHALRRLADYDPDKPLMPAELARLAHVLLAAAMTYDQIGQTGRAVDKPKESSQTGILIDKASRSVWIDGSRVKLRGHSYDLLCALYDQAGHRRTRKELIEQVFGERYDESDNSQIAKLNTAIRRLRERIEIDPDRPRYLLTETGVGYMLLVQPSG